jgi:hypothetical protein
MSESLPEPQPAPDSSAHAATLHAQRMFEALRLQREGLIAERDALADEVARLTWLLRQNGVE